ncbi:MAG: four helix bundle protein [Candidatus Kaiserbacteria bacterium]|nr:four helix bundle protein [Candidatus Kaiserbacteria bacterium]
MNGTHSHPSEATPPPTISQPKLIPVVLKLKDSYGLWQEYLVHFPKANRFTLGSKIDDIFLHAIEYCFLASYIAHIEKILLVDRCIARVDLLKLLLQLAWEMQALDTKKYTRLLEYLMEVGRMLGGWRKQLQNKTPAV